MLIESERYFKKSYFYRVTPIRHLKSILIIINKIIMIIIIANDNRLTLFKNIHNGLDSYSVQRFIDILLFPILTYKQRMTQMLGMAAIMPFPS